MDEIVRAVRDCPSGALSRAVDGDGADVERAAGTSREHYALCRCGHSRNKPFCSRMHWNTGFADPAPDPEATPTVRCRRRSSAGPSAAAVSTGATPG